MINLNSFVNAIHDAILKANDSLMDSNVALLDKYFDESVSDIDGNRNLVPKTVILEYPTYSSSGQLETSEIQVPLITLVPLSMSRIEKAVLTAEFEMEIVNNELQINLLSKSNSGFFHKKPETKSCKLEITLSPQEPSEGIKILVEGYEAILKRQIP